jgi:hypothetical protein
MDCLTWNFNSTQNETKHLATHQGLGRAQGMVNYSHYPSHDGMAQIIRDELCPWSTALLKQLTVTQFVNKFSAVYWTWIFTTKFTKSHYWTLYCARWIQVTLTPYHFKIHSDIILPHMPFTDDKGSKYLWNISQFLTDYIVQHLKRQSSSNINIFETLVPYCDICN